MWPPKKWNMKTAAISDFSLEERTRQRSRFRVLAPISGSVVSDELDSLIGTYLDEGHELMVIGDERQKEIRLSIAQSDARAFSARVGQPVTARLKSSSFKPLELSLGAVEPGVSRRVENLAITAAGGGKLVVRPSAAKRDRDDAWEFVHPRLTARVELSTDRCSKLASWSSRDHQTAVLAILWERPAARRRTLVANSLANHREKLRAPNTTQVEATIAQRDTT